MRGQRKDGKRINTEKMKDGDGTDVLVEFRMIMLDQYAGRATKYWAECDAIPGWSTERNESIDEVAKIARKAIASHKTVTWEEQLQIGFAGGPRWRSPETLDVPKDWEKRDMHDLCYELDLQIRPVAVGLVGGKTMHRNNGDRHARDGGPAALHSNSGSMNGSTIADTPQNRQAINVILKAFKELSVKLTKLLGDDNAQHVLTAIAAGQPLLLAGPKEETDAKKTRKKQTKAGS